VIEALKQRRCRAVTLEKHNERLAYSVTHTSERFQQIEGWRA
jgi:hypothetical protein